MQNITEFMRDDHAHCDDLFTTAVMRREHAQMLELIATLGAALTHRATDTYLGTAETLLLLIRQHNLKDAQIRYPAADRALSGESEAIVTRPQARAD
ncbi:MAG: hypothetical protein ACFCUG_02520 [Thiotrichales bacterium]